MSLEWQRLAAPGNGCAPAGNPFARQQAWLMNCIDRNRSTAYGRQYQFERIRTVQEYRDRVPIGSYEELAPQIERMAGGEPDVLFQGHPVAFERTGGSSGGSKLIPYSESSLRDFRVALLPWLADVIRTFGISSGAAYWSISPATRKPEMTAGGISVGLPDGAYLGNDALSAFAAISAVPAWVGAVTDVSEWQMATLYGLLCRRDLALISVWSPTFFLAILDALESRKDGLDALLRKGGELAGYALAANHAAAGRLDQFIASRKTSVLWPGLKLVSCWADASSRPFFEDLKQRLPHAAFQGKGLLSSEGVVTVPRSQGSAALAVDSGFFEFLDDEGASRLAHEVNPGQQYEVVMTTSGGLYRYRTGDRVCCKEFVENVPAFCFLGRAGLTSDIVGEKLTEEFVGSCLTGIPGFRLLFPVTGSGVKYALVLDEKAGISHASVLSLVEQRLARNPQYAYARRIGQLGELLAYSVARPLESYVNRCIKNGARMGDVKVTALRAETDWLQTFLETAS